MAANNFSETGRLLANKSITEKGLIQAKVIEQVGNTITDLIAVHKISVEARARVQVMALKLAEKAISQQQGIKVDIVRTQAAHLALRDRIRAKIDKFGEEYS